MNWIKNKNRVFLLLFLISCGKLFSQTGVTCTLSRSITVNSPCTMAAGPVSTPNPIELPALGACATPTTNSRDLWVRFQAINVTATISITSSAAGSAPNRNVAFILYDVPCTCPSGTITNTAELACVNAITTTAAQTESIVINTLIVGQIYFMRVLCFNGGSTSPQYQICVDSPVANDNPTSSTSLGTPGSSCVNIAGNLKNATKTTCGGLAPPLCANYGPGSVDVWYSVTVPGSGNLFIQTSSSAMSSMGIATYTGTPCVGLTQLGCSEGNPEDTAMGYPAINVPGLTGGTTVYVRVWNQNGVTPGTFSICATTLGPCGHALTTNNYCERPYAVFTSGVTNTMVAVGYTGTPVYTEDLPGNLNNVSCGTALNTGNVYNSWYTFVATSPTVSMPITASNCEVDIELFSVSTNTYGCCKSFIPVSGLDVLVGDCSAFTWSVAPNSTATITASGLANGKTYYMMVNYPAGPACSFSVTGWAYTGVLPVDLISFTAESAGKNNKINWTVGNEATIDSYVVEHSHDANMFYPIGVLEAKGNVATNTSYEFLDDVFFKDITYYRIRQKLKDGTEKYTNTISVVLDDKYDNVYNIYPNPTTNNLNFEYYLKRSGSIHVSVLDYTGKSAFNFDYNLTEGKNNIVLPMVKLENGVYILEVTSLETGKVTHNKIIKN
jgi:hypothetical protein